LETLQDDARFPQCELLLRQKEFMCKLQHLTTSETVTSVVNFEHY